VQLPVIFSGAWDLRSTTTALPQIGRQLCACSSRVTVTIQQTRRIGLADGAASSRVHHPVLRVGVPKCLDRARPIGYGRVSCANESTATAKTAVQHQFYHRTAHFQRTQGEFIGKLSNFEPSG
jgi:hypothetical protein